MDTKLSLASWSTAVLLSHFALLTTAAASVSYNLGDSLATGFYSGLIYCAAALAAYFYFGASNRPRFYALINSAGLGLMLLLTLMAAWALGEQLLAPGAALVDLGWQLISLLLCMALGASAILLRRQSLQLAMAEQGYEQVIQKLFAGPSLVISLVLALLLCLLNLLALVNFADVSELAAVLRVKMLDRGVIPPLSLLLFYWGLLLLLGKFLGDLRLIRSLGDQDNPLGRVAEQLTGTAEQERALALLWQSNDSFYALPQYLNWAIPILGFIGTVLGISLAAESISGVIAASQTALSDSLAQAIAPLGIAFDTTLIALSLSVVLVLLQTLLRRFEERKFVAFEHKLAPNSPQL